MSIFGMVSCGGMGRASMPIAFQYFNSLDIETVFVEKTGTNKTVNGYRVMSEEDFFSLTYREKYFIVALGSSKLREELSNRFLDAGCKAHTLIAKTSIVYDDVRIGEGSLLCDNTMLTSNIRIGKHFQGNIYSYVEHDCEIGDYVTFAPRVSCNGRVKIGNHAYIGSGAVIKNGTVDKPLVIGEGAVVGAGAVVVKDVAPYTTVVGNPARIMEKK